MQTGPSQAVPPLALVHSPPWELRSLLLLGQQPRVHSLQGQDTASPSGHAVRKSGEAGIVILLL